LKFECPEFGQSLRKFLVIGEQLVLISSSFIPWGQTTVSAIDFANRRSEQKTIPRRARLALPNIPMHIIQRYVQCVNRTYRRSGIL
jgi:hypothetical protein